MKERLFTNVHIALMYTIAVVAVSTMCVTRSLAAAIPVLTSVLGVPATRTIRGIPTEVRLGPEDGMPDECALALDNVRPIRKAFCVERICTLGPPVMHQVCRALALAADCGG